MVFFILKFKEESRQQEQGSQNHQWMQHAQMIKEGVEPGQEQNFIEQRFSRQMTFHRYLSWFEEKLSHTTRCLTTPVT